MNYYAQVMQLFWRFGDFFVFQSSFQQYFDPPGDQDIQYLHVESPGSCRFLKSLSDRIQKVENAFDLVELVDLLDRSYIQCIFSFREGLAKLRGSASSSLDFRTTRQGSQWLKRVSRCSCKIKTFKEVQWYAQQHTLQELLSHLHKFFIYEPLYQTVQEMQKKKLSICSA